MPEIDIKGFGGQTARQWMNLPLYFTEKLRQEPEKWRSMVVPIKIVEKHGLSEFIFYCVVPNQEFQDMFLEIQSRFPDEEKTKKAQEMFKDALAGIKSILENLKEEWKIIYRGEILEEKK